MYKYLENVKSLIIKRYNRYMKNENKIDFEIIGRVKIQEFEKIVKLPNIFKNIE